MIVDDLRRQLEAQRERDLVQGELDAALVMHARAHDEMRAERDAARRQLAEEGASRIRHVREIAEQRDAQIVRAEAAEADRDRLRTALKTAREALALVRDCFDDHENGCLSERTGEAEDCDCLTGIAAEQVAAIDAALKEGT